MEHRLEQSMSVCGELRKQGLTWGTGVRRAGARVPGVHVGRAVGGWCEIAEGPPVLGEGLGQSPVDTLTYPTPPY